MCYHQVRGKIIQVEFYEKLEQVFFLSFPKYKVTIQIGGFNAKVGRKNRVKPTIGNDSLKRIKMIMVLEQ
jgi:hypothetical protein